MDTTLNYQTLAMDIVMAALEDARGDDNAAYEAQEWLDNIDLSGIGIEGLDIDDLEYVAQNG